MPGEHDQTDGQSPAMGAKLNWLQFELRLLRISERLNPILVKEARQALKSKQFLVTFNLLLVAGWAWSLLGIALLSPGVYYAPGGQFMLIGYYLVLAAPLLVVVPFSAFRSLAGEREDGTFELLTITTLSSRQIITGKLGSAVLQMLVYYSALAPCIVFTYLLRGVDIVGIIFILVYSFLISLLLSAAGLVVATASNSRNWQVVLSVLLLVGLLLAILVWTIVTIQIVAAGQSVPFNDWDFWISNIAVFSFAVSFLVLFILAAAAQISFASDNRATRLRVMLLSQQVLWVGWFSYFWLHWEQTEFLFVTVSILALYWYFMGSLMVGEFAVLSPRVKRSLPQSFTGRMMLTWFNPGSGTGYTFAIANLWSAILVLAIVGLQSQRFAFPGAPPIEWFMFAGMAGAYVTIYLGIGRLFIMLLRRIAPVGIALSMMIHILIAMLGVGIPLFFQAWIQGYTNLNYTSFQVTNWAWTLVTTAGGDLLGYPLVSAAVVLLGLPITCGLNLLLTMAEVEQVRQETPRRVQRDITELPEESETQPPDWKSVATMSGSKPTTR